MGKQTDIAWTDHTFNIVWGCTKVSPACHHCYAESFAKRVGFKVWGQDAPRRTFAEKHWQEPLRWNAAAERARQRRRVFCSSMADVFEDHPTVRAEREKLWPLIEATPWLDWQLLTKRPENLLGALPWGEGEPWRNVWVGTTVENPDYGHRLTELTTVPAFIHFASLEPLLAPVDLGPWLGALDWVIAGSESGARARPMDEDWVRSLRDQCQGAGVYFFYKQRTVGRKVEQTPELDGHRWTEFPDSTPLASVLPEKEEVPARTEGITGR